MDLKSRIEKSLIVKSEEEFADIPSNMLLELTNICNHDCLFCSHYKMTRKPGYMEWSLIERLLKEAHDIGVTDVGLYATGEAMLSPYVADAVKYAKNIGYSYVYITSNGDNDFEKYMKLIDAGIDSIKFSINAGDGNVYRKIHGRNSFDRVVDNLKKISVYRPKIKLYVSCVLTKYTLEQKEELISLVDDYVDEIVFNHCDFQSGYMRENRFLRYPIDSPRIKIPCSQLYNCIHISYEGYMVACCSDMNNYLVISDLKKTTIRKAWNCNKFCELRKQHIDKKLGKLICKGCINSSSDINFEPYEHQLCSKFDFSENIDRIKERIEIIT